MWRLYAHSEEAVAVETEYARLTTLLPENVFVGCINYIDYDTEWLPEGNSLYPFTHKRKSFEHEKEIRAVIQELPNQERGIAVGIDNQSSGVTVKIDLEKLIKVVHVSPTAPRWFAGLTSDIAKKYGLSAPIKQSDLYSSPVY